MFNFKYYGKFTNCRISSKAKTLTKYLGMILTLLPLMGT